MVVTNDLLGRRHRGSDTLGQILLCHYQSARIAAACIAIIVVILADVGYMRHWFYMGGRL